MNRRSFIQKAGTGAAALVGSYAMGPLGMPLFVGNKKQPNILFITTDYQAGEDLPGQESPFLFMPHLEKLCNEGIVFDRHYCTASISIPARYTIITGQYPHTHGAWDNVGHWVPEGSPLFMKQLALHGYSVTGVGKMHFNPWYRLAGFDYRIDADRKGNVKADNDRLDDYAQFLAGHGLTRWSYLRKQSTADIFGVYDWPFSDELHIDHYVGEQTVHAIERSVTNCPWFIWSSFNGPHNPWDPPARCSDRYKRMDLPRARQKPGELQTKPLDHTRTRYNYTRAVVDRIDKAPPGEREELINRIRAGHYGGLSFIDEQIGRIVNALGKSGQLDNTIIIFSADHGCELGDHHNIHKGLFYERSARVPMVVWSPVRYCHRHIDSYSGHVDLFPTFLSMAGIEITPELTQQLEGADLTPVLNEAGKPGQQQAFNEIRGGTNIVTNDWKMSIYPSDGCGELYDRNNDPDELNNLYSDTGYISVRKELTERLVEFHPPLNDQIVRMRPVVFNRQQVYKFNPGDHILPQDAPYQAGKAIRLSAVIHPDNNTWEDGPVVACYVSVIHGYALYIKNGHLFFGFRRWGNDVLITSPNKLPLKTAQIGASVSRNGDLRLIVDGVVVSAGKVEGPLPVQEGHERVVAPHIFVGHSPGWCNPVGDYEKEQKLSDHIVSVAISFDQD